MILPAQTIRSLCLPHDILAEPLLSPFHERTVAANGMTYGLGPASYDIRLDQGFVGTKGIPAISFSIPPGGFALCSSLEYFHIPSDLLCRVADKSSWARRGLVAQNTVIDPGWHGHLTLELTNHSREVIKLTQGDPLVQLIFERLEAPTEMPYNGKYQNQEAGPVAAR